MTNTSVFAKFNSIRLQISIYLFIYLFIHLFIYFIYLFILFIYSFNFGEAFLQICVDIYIQPLAVAMNMLTSLVCSMHSMIFGSSIFDTHASMKNRCQF